MILASKQNIKMALQAYGEFDIADKANNLTDVQA